MKLLKALLVLLLGIAGHAPAQDNSNDEWPLAKGDEPYGVVVGSVGKRAEYIYPVEIVEVDGNNLFPREAVWLKPGKHTVTVRGFVTNPPGLRSASRFNLRQDESSNTIELVVEEGKTYMIGLKNEPRETTQPYRVVLYRVEGEDNPAVEESGPDGN